MFYNKILFCLLFLQSLLVVGINAGELTDLNAIVTRGSRGIGKACVFTLAREGANVAIAVNKSTDEAEKVAERAKQLGIDAYVLQCDVANRWSNF